MRFISEDIEKYCKDYSVNDTDLLKKLSKTTWETEEVPQMLSGSLVGGLLQMLVKISGAERILEIGMFTGYSALKMAEALPVHGTIDSCELMDKHIDTATGWFNKSEVGHKITVHKGQAIESLERFVLESFDLIFVDADKVNYPL